uniref:MYND-type domain-containing protein n=1 Tax=Panagrolaimus superbus TaxID=310955 RepID=A0A914XZT2_9BILA
MDDDILGFNESKDADSPLNIPINDVVTENLAGLHQHWMNEYLMSRDKHLSEVANKLHADFLSDQENIRKELMKQFTEELLTTKKNLEVQYMATLKHELLELRRRHTIEISEAKKSQWCNVCLKESIFYCCWNTTYCSTECQHKHWILHRLSCRRGNNRAASKNNNDDIKCIQIIPVHRDALDISSDEPN